MVIPAKLASDILLCVFCLLFVLVYLFIDCLFNWSTEMAVLT